MLEIESIQIREVCLTGKVASEEDSPWRLDPLEAVQSALVQNLEAEFNDLPAWTRTVWEDTWVLNLRSLIQLVHAGKKWVNLGGGNLRSPSSSSLAFFTTSLSLMKRSIERLRGLMKNWDQIGKRD